MSILKAEDEKKWVNTLVAVLAVLVGYITIKFVGQMSDWFDLEAKVSNFLIVSQGIGVLVGLITFTAIKKSQKTMDYLNSVFHELTKVIWPESESVGKLTVGIIIGLVIISSLFVGVDYIIRWLIKLII